jgi:hypothetical protein
MPHTRQVAEVARRPETVVRVGLRRHLVTIKLMKRDNGTRGPYRANNVLHVECSWPYLARGSWRWPVSLRQL